MKVGIILKIYRKDIQSLRGLAVVAVIAFHVSQYYFPLGYFGVDIFFVISGYVITPMLIGIFSKDRQNRSPAPDFQRIRFFYSRRFWRLAPALSVTISGTCILVIFLCSPNDFGKVFKQGFATMFLLGNLGASRYAGDYFSPSPNPLLHAWSLSVEEQIYIIFPIILSILIAKSHNFLGRFKFLFSALALGSLYMYLHPQLLSNSYQQIAGANLNTTFAFYSPINRFWEFLVGGLCFLFFDRKNPERKALGTVITLVICCYLFSSLSINPQLGTVLVVFMAFLAIAIKAFEYLPEILNRMMQWIGDRSYSIYLFHMPLLYLAKYSSFTRFGNSINNQCIQIALAVLATFVLATLSYSKFEVPFRQPNSERRTFKAFYLIVIPLVLLISVGALSHFKYFLPELSATTNIAAWNSGAKECVGFGVSTSPCVSDTKFSNSALLIGDSHAADLSAAFLVSARLEHLNGEVWTLGDCPITFNSLSTQVSSQCLAQNRKIYQFIQVNRPTIIIISEYIKPNMPLEELKNALELIKSIVPNVIYIENTPVFRDDISFGANRPILRSIFQGNSPEVVDLENMNLNAMNASKPLAQYGTLHKISIINFNSIFCSPKACSRFQNGKWLFFDSNHLSTYGAALTIPLFREFLHFYVDNSL